MKNRFLLIAGGGKFGKKAIKFAKKNKYSAIIIDNNPNCLASKEIPQRFEDLAELIEYSNQHQKDEILFLESDISIINKILNEFKFSWFIPVVPIHLTALIVKNFMISNNIQLLSDNITCKVYSRKIKPDLLLTSPIQEGIVYLSYAKEDEVCPEDCPGPPNYCPTFKRVKPITITDYLKKIFEISGNFNLLKHKKKLIIIVHSYQLMPGLGGLKGLDIYSIYNLLKENLNYLKKSQLDLIVATSCNCHGVINFYKSGD
jgi:hypothetical protein